MSDTSRAVYDDTQVPRRLFTEAPDREFSNVSEEKTPAAAHSQQALASAVTMILAVARFSKNLGVPGHAAIDNSDLPELIKARLRAKSVKEFEEQLDADTDVVLDLIQSANGEIASIDSVIDSLKKSLETAVGKRAEIQRALDHGNNTLNYVPLLKNWADDKALAAACVTADMLVVPG